MTPHPPYDLRSVAARFEIPGRWVSACSHGNGHINDTFAATYEQDGKLTRYVIQRINHLIFQDPPRMMENIRRVTDHLRDKGEPTLNIVPTVDGNDVHRDTLGNYWRAYLFVEDADAFEVAASAGQASEAARAFGRFQILLADLPGPRLRETIPNFHDTPARFRALQAAISTDPRQRAKLAVPEIEFALSHEADVHVLQDACARGEIPERIAHNDTKLNNVLFARTTGRALCVTDLDTVMPGLVLHDFGDLVRTTTSPASEDEQDLSKVVLQLPMFEALIQGYLDAAGLLLTAAEKELLAFSGKVITLETGIRFLTDFLSGDTYFKVQREGQNLDRCRTQFALVRDMEQQENTLRSIVARCS
jgi:Ser/Thr protein kinase RdoA (MazF antagonist)